MTASSLPDVHLVRKATAADVPRLASAMARAFYDDPVVGDWCMPDASRRSERLERGFRLFLERTYLRHDACYASDSVAGAALWLPPGTWRLGGMEQLRLAARMAVIHTRGVPRILRVLAFLEARHPHEPHYYLAFVGVQPEGQGRGIGSALMAPVLECCDRDGLPAYLEATSERNLALYERHGFEVVETLRLPEGGPPVWRMWRPAGA
jgi:ribosomal protein S18 acetylase RimI-like enzyme